MDDGTPLRIGRGRLGRRLFAVLAGSCLLPLLAVLGLAGHLISGSLFEARLDLLRQLAAHSSQRIDSFLALMRQDAMVIAQLSGPATETRDDRSGAAPLEPALRQMGLELEALIGNRQIYEDLRVYDGLGRERLHLRYSGGQPQEIDPAADLPPEGLEQAEHLPGVTLAVDRKSGGPPTLTVFAPSFDRAGRRRGTVVLRVPRAALAAAMAEKPPAASVGAVLADSDGEVFTSLPTGDASEPSHLSMLFGLDWQWVTVQSAQSRADLNGLAVAHQAVVWGPGEGQFWKVVAFAPRAWVVAPLERIVLGAAMLGLVLLPLSLLAGGLFLRRLVVRPLRALQQAMERFQAGDLEARVRPVSGEIGAVGESFNRLALGLVEGRRHLEHLVEQRTLAQEMEVQYRRRTQAILTDALDAVEESFIVFDSEDRMVVCNTQARLMLGRHAGLLVPGVTYRDLLRELAEAGFLIGAAGREREWLEERMARHRQSSNWYEERTTDGRWIEVREWRTPDGGTVAIRLDVTERKEAERALLASEQALKHSEERHRLLVETMSEGLIVTDSDLRVTYVNERLAGLAGRPAASLIGLPLTEVFHPDCRPALVERRMRGGEGPYQAILDSGQGRRVEVLVSPAPFHDGAGRLVGKMSVVTDITDLKLAQEALRQSELRFRALFYDAPFGMLLLDADGRLVEGNRAFCRLFGLAAGMPPENLEETGLAAHILSGLRGQAAAAWEGRLRRADGAEIWVRAHAASVVDPLGGPPNIIATIEDISDRKSVESRMAHSSKLMLLGELSAGLAHEITQPLNVIRLTSESTLARIDGGDITLGEARGKLKVINEQADRLFDVIDYMQAFSRRESEKREYFDGFTSVRAAIALVDESFRQRRVTIRDQIEAAVCTLLGHPRQLEQVILNLLTNARDAVVEARGTAGGTITVSAWCNQKTGLAHIRVEDEGTGITDSHLSRLFEPFFSTKGPGKGTGLGLSISFGIVNGMGGCLEAGNRRDGRGARFDLALPIARPADGAPPPLSGPSPAALPAPAEIRPAHIMVVEDEVLAAEEIADYLGRTGYRVSVHDNGVEAVGAFLKDPADLVITDLNMPEGDGHSMIDALLVDHPQLPIIVVTGRPITRADDLEEVASGADLVLRKPIHLRELADHVRRLLA